MNSLTPVTSLARSSADMVAAAEKAGADVADARQAAETVARRAEGILRFVESYREFAQTPEVHRRSFKAGPWAEEILRLAMASAGERRVEGRVEVRPKSLSLTADPELLPRRAQLAAQRHPGHERQRGAGRLADRPARADWPLPDRRRGQWAGHPAGSPGGYLSALLHHPQGRQRSRLELRPPGRAGPRRL